MEARTLNCPMCGAAARSDSSKCSHCGSRLATTACPSCFNLMFIGEKHCSMCGAEEARALLGTRRTRGCPRCQSDLHGILVGDVKVKECAACDGLWIENETFEELCARHEQQVVFMGRPTVQDPTTGSVDPVRYLKCPACTQLMNRVNFAGCSGVIVDVCKTHGTWFDRAELRRIIEFIQDGGMDKARDREIRRLQQEQRRVAEQRMAGPGFATADHSPGGWSGTATCGEIDVIECIGKVLLQLFKIWTR